MCFRVVIVAGDKKIVNASSPLLSAYVNSIKKRRKAESIIIDE